MERWRNEEGEGKDLSFQGSLPNGCRGELSHVEAWTSIMISHMDWQGPRHWEHLLLFPEEHLQGAGSEVEHLGLKYGQ